MVNCLELQKQFSDLLETQVHELTTLTFYGKTFIPIRQLNDMVTRIQKNANISSKYGKGLYDGLMLAYALIARENMQQNMNEDIYNRAKKRLELNNAKQWLKETETVKKIFRG